LPNNGAHAVEFGRSICGDLAAAERREWLVTNGLGGFASGTIAGTLTRRYHGLLIAALSPPVGRTLLVTKADESAAYRDAVYDLATNRWSDDYIAPCGFTQIERFYLDGTTPVWQYALADALLEKRIWMEPGANTTFVRYRLLHAASSIALALRVLVNCRDFHGNTHAGGWEMAIVPAGRAMRIDPGEGMTTFWICSDRGEAAVENIWYRDFVLSEEARRGLDDRDDNLCAGRITATLQPGESLTMSAGVGDDVILRQAQDDKRQAQDDGAAAGEMAWGRRIEHEAAVLGAWMRTGSAEISPPWMHQCVLAADQFVVAAPAASDPDARAVIAGYHWFGPWGRDTMIALPGLTLTTGRPKIAKQILMTAAAFIDEGILPNFFAESGEAIEYNTVDAALWYVEAVARYVSATGDRETLAALWPSLRNVIESYRDGTRYGIHMDGDGLIAAGAAGVALTWMDAKIGDWVVTPRVGKPIEISALWYNALERMKQLATLLGMPIEAYDRLAQVAAGGFERFWNAQALYCYDVLDGPNGDDATLRPNQIFAVALAHSPLSFERQRAVVDACAASLLTSNGLRTLAPSDPRFVPHYYGSQDARDAAYHQGTVWPWLLGPFAIAYALVYGDAMRARSLLEPLANLMTGYGLGSICEISDGAAPFTARGAIAQAWSIAELLRAWHELSAMAAQAQLS
jgi:glycogen debranching enzyme